MPTPYAGQVWELRFGGVCLLVIDHARQRCVFSTAHEVETTVPEEGQSWDACWEAALERTLGYLRQRRSSPDVRATRGGVPDGGAGECGGVRNRSVTFRDIPHGTQFA